VKDKSAVYTSRYISGKTSSDIQHIEYLSAKWTFAKQNESD